MDLNDKILISGGSGFLGMELIKVLKEQGYTHIVSLARNEEDLIELKKEFPDVGIIIGDVSDRAVIKEAMLGAKGVFHLAAQKHVGLAEKYVLQTIKSNVYGSVNIIEESYITKPEFVLGVSTDKAANPTGIYGETKALMEGLFRQAERANPDTQYRVVRYGNVMGSTASFITKWKPLMEQGKEVILTDPNATRFFWSLGEAIDLIFECLEKSTDATPKYPEMKAIAMGVALEAAMEKYGKSPVKIIGLQQGENMHETMDGITYSNEVPQFTKQEFIDKFL